MGRFRPSRSVGERSFAERHSDDPTTVREARQGLLANAGRFAARAQGYFRAAEAPYRPISDEANRMLNTFLTERIVDLNEVHVHTFIPSQDRLERKAQK